MPDNSSPASERSRRAVWAGEARARLRSLRLAPTRESEIVEELSQHLDDRYRELIAAGDTHDEATRRALAEFSRRNLLAERMKPLRQAHAPAALVPGAPAGHVLATIWQDLRYAVRFLSRQPGFTLAAVVSLALGIGVNTTMFSVVHGVLLQGLPYPDADRLVRLVQAHSQSDLTMAEYEVVRDHAGTFAAVAAYRGGGERRVGRAEDQNWITTVMVTTDFFKTLGVNPQLGREFTADEVQPGGPAAVIVSDSVWRNLFSADPQILGRTIVLNDAAATVVGVMPPDLWFPQQLDAALPLRNAGTLGDTGTNTQVIARLAAGVSLAQAQAEIAALTDRILEAARNQLARAYRGLTVRTYRDWLVGDVRVNLLLLFGATGVLLVIACGNLALLLLSRAAARAREFAVRTALGSSGQRLLRQLLTENLLLATAGAIAGLMAAAALVDIFVSLLPFSLPTAAPIRVNAVVLAFTVLVSVATAVFVTVVPFLGSRRISLSMALQADGRNAGAATIRSRTRNAFIAAEVALATTLLVAAVLLLQTLYRTTQEQLGFAPEQVLTFQTPFAPERARDPADRLAFTQSLLAQLEQTPGVAAAAATNLLPLSGQSNLPTQRDGHPDLSIGGMEVRAVSARYFEVMGMPIRHGRSITAREVDSAAPVVVVNETVARAWWPDGAALGDRLIIGRFQGKALVQDVPREVVGIVADTKTTSLQAAARPTVFVPVTASFGAPSAAWVVKVTGHRVLAEGIRAAVAAVDPAQRLTRIRMMGDIVATAAARPRFNASLFAIFASVALLLTIVGLYGVLSFVVAQRRHEIGTRMALGASRAAILSAFVRQGLTLTALGLAVGFAGAWFVARWLSSLLFGVPPHDLASFAAVAVLVLSVGAVASYIPARRAATIDPLVAMRGE